jgi:hypothetical protein
MTNTVFATFSLPFLISLFYTKLDCGYVSPSLSSAIK